ncbi:MAG: DEAD/DEAH box helicase family protein, partial [Anaerolineales bacterium]|nr:DEAD/DEAH box helicase family protein [Anaerolineales bacterium]
MLARVVDNKWINIEQISVPEEDILDKAFSVKHPRAQYIDTSNGFFDGVYHKYNKFHHRLARPLWRELQAVCKIHGLPLGYADDRPPPKYPVPELNMITKDMLSGVTLYDYQVDAIKSICRNEVGIISLVTGGGKTEIMAGIAKALDCPTVILCEMTVVVDQIKERLELRKIVEEVGMFYAGKRPNGQRIIVGSFQSLIIPSAPKKTKRDTPESYARKIKGFKTRRKNARKLRDIIGKCDLLLVDECDSASSKKWKQLFWHWFKGRRRYGFSGT